MREFVSRLDSYFIEVDAYEHKCIEPIDLNASLEFTSELAVASIKDDAEASLDLTVPLLLFIGLITCLGWIHPNGC